MLNRSSLVLFDRYLLDVLVDPKRYRYGGPQWLIRKVWSVVPKPDVVILLDAPAEVLQSRKQEVPFEETKRQREAYRQVVECMATGHIVEASGSVNDVATEVKQVIVGSMADRAARCQNMEPSA